MVTIELQSKTQLELIEKALGSLWAEGLLDAREQYQFTQVERALDHAMDQPHESGEPTWLR